MAKRGIVTDLDPRNNIPVDTWTMLRAVAFARAQETGERPSVSALITELAEQHRAELEAEAGV